MSNAAYSDLKAAWHQDKIAQLRDGKQIVPSQVQLIISDLCNHDCHFCAYRMSGGFSTELFGEFTDKGLTMNPNRKIETSKALEILDDCAEMGVKAIQFTGGGEPTVHQDHIAIFRHAQDLGMQTSLVTNGSLLRDGWSEVMPKMSWLRVSVDAGRSETYAKARRVKESMFDRVWMNINSIGKTLRAFDSKCLFGVGFVVTMQNWQELDRAAMFAKASGAAYIRVSAMFSAEGARYYNGDIGRIRENIRTVKNRYDSDDFAVVNLFGNRIEDLEQHGPDYSFCGYQQFNMYIGADLNVYRCCTTSYTKRGLVGNLSNARLSEWFTSDEKLAAYHKFNAKGCHTCQFNGKNRVINYLIDPEPVHVNFV